MNIYSTTSLLAFLVCISLSILVYLKQPRNAINKFFTLATTLMGLWCLFPFVVSIGTSEKDALYKARLIYSTALFTPPTFLHFIFILIGINRLKYIRRVTATSYIFAILFFIILFHPQFINGVRRGIPFFAVRPGYLYLIFILYFGILCTYTVWESFVIFRKSIGAKRNQLKYLFLAFLSAFIGGIMHFLAACIGREPFPHDFLIISYVIIMAYAIARYRLMDINIAIRNFLAYMIEMVVLSIFLFLLLGAFGFKEILPMVLSSLGIALGLIPLRTGIRRFINRVIFRGKYDYQEKLADITNVVPTIIDQDRLIRYIVDNITESMHIKKGAIFFKDERKDVYTLQYAVGLDGADSNKTIEGKDRLIKWLKEHKDVLLRYELYHIMSPKEVEELWDNLKYFESELVVPLHKGENLIGLLCLSHKGGGDVFNQDDFRILQTIANQAAVVIENIRLYNKLIHTDRQTFLETLAGGVSHEMRNRLVAIRTFIDLFPERVDLEHVEKGYIEFRELAVREMARLTKIIDGLLSYSRAVTTGGETLNVNDLLDEALLIIQPKLREKEINLETNLDKNISTLTGDKGRLLQVFINIMQNGIEAMKKGGRLVIGSTDKEEDIEVSIADNGKGIPKEYLDAIFEPFFTTKHNGTGLGLSIVQRIVRDHSGTINVASEVGKGAIFTVIFDKKGGYKPTEISPKEELGYWDVKKEYEAPETKDEQG